MELYINMVLLTLLAAVTVAIIRQRNLFGVVVLAGAYSFLMASVMLVLDAVDVAMTEASVGAGVSTVFFLATLHLTRSMELKPAPRFLVPAGFSILLVVILIYGTFDLPAFGLATAPVHVHVAPHYISQSIPETTVPNVVTSVLGSYRGFDTLGETTVVFTAALGVLLLLRRRRRSSDQSSEKDATE
ncbi:MAG: DUF4040 domain-containing protein [Pseudomonadota bacterium]